MGKEESSGRQRNVFKFKLPAWSHDELKSLRAVGVGPPATSHGLVSVSGHWADCLRAPSHHVVDGRFETAPVDHSGLLKCILLADGLTDISSLLAHSGP